MKWKANDKIIIHFERRENETKCRVEFYDTIILSMCDEDVNQIKLKWNGKNTLFLYLYLPLATWLGKFVQSFNWNSETALDFHMNLPISFFLSRSLAALSYHKPYELECGAVWKNHRMWPIGELFSLPKPPPGPHPIFRLITIIRRIYVDRHVHSGQHQFNKVYHSPFDNEILL